MTAAAREIPGSVLLSSRLLAGSAGLGVVIVLAAVAAWSHLGDATDAYVRAAVAADLEHPQLAPDQVRVALLYNLATAAVTALAVALLAVVIRQPARWARVSTWCATVVTWLALGCGLVAGPETAGPAEGINNPLLRQLRQSLIPDWYASVEALLVLGILAALTTAAVLLARSPAQEYYYRASASAEDPQWGAIFQARASRAREDPPAGGEPDRADGSSV
jgi:hypothetical protein